MANTEKLDDNQSYNNQNLSSRSMDRNSYPYGKGSMTKRGGGQNSGVCTQNKKD